MWLLSVAAVSITAIRAVGPAARWPNEPPAYPLYPGRAVHVLNGTWDFVFLGDVPLAPVVPQVSVWQKVTVPDAFDLRPDRPRCGECWPSDGDDESRCHRCCDRALGHQGDLACWDVELRLEQRAVPLPSEPPTFERCCGEDPLRWSRGVGAYRVEVETPSGVASVLHLAGCALRCLIAVDGRFVADHSGLSPFTIDVPPSGDLPGAGSVGMASVRRTLLVLADNRFDRRTHPVHQPHYDWYQAGGLLRTAQFHVFAGAEPVYIMGVDVFPRSFYEVHAIVRSSPAAAGRSDLSYRWRFDDNEEPSSCRVWAGWGELDPIMGLLDVEVPHARIWSPQSPHLHRLKIALLERGVGSRLLDCVEVRFGLRIVEARGREIHINREPVKLFGFNRHDMTDTPVLSYDDIVRDVELLKAAGANFVRGAHYAQDQRFLDMCDVHGILVWEEVLGWQNTAADFSDGIFMSQSLRLADELASASANHPSVVLLGFFNEGDSGDDGIATSVAYAAMAGRLRDRSHGSRLVSWGSNAAINDRQLAIADVCSFHAYTAWYPTTKPVDLSEVQDIPILWQGYGLWVAENFPEKPFLITEAGAGGIFGHHGPTDRKWTEEYQSLVMQMHFLAAMRNPLIAGIAIWQFADTPTDRNISSEHHRPRGLNNKGVMSLSRQPKIAFHALRILRTQQPRQYFGLILPGMDAERLSGELRI